MDTAENTAKDISPGKEGRHVGKRVKRMEDKRFIQGRGNYLDDVELPNMLHMAIVHSPYAHATINGINTEEGSRH
jgi:aerobic carbon-monoxide dehydrogenase large subunit